MVAATSGIPNHSGWGALRPRKPDSGRVHIRYRADDYGVKEIAARLELSPKTVEFHKHQIMAEFDLKNNASLVLFAVKEGLISIDPDIVYAPRKVS